MVRVQGSRAIVPTVIAVATILLVCCVPHRGRVKATTELTDVMACPEYVPSLLAGNNANIATLLDWCVANPSCSRLYGQSVMMDVKVFALVLQTSTELDDPVHLESALTEFVCPPGTNLTWGDVNKIYMVHLLMLHVLQNNKACENHDTQLVNPDTQELQCTGIPYEEKPRVRGINLLTLAVIVVLLLIAAIVAIVELLKLLALQHMYRKRG
jgi:hypothetical protein